MVHKIGKITIYVNDQEEAKKFWTEKIKFGVSLEHDMGNNYKWIEVTPNLQHGPSFVLYDKNLMQSQNPETNVGHPSIILCTVDIDHAHEKMIENGVEVTDVIKMPYGSMFTFKDQDGNEYLLREERANKG